MSLKNPLFFIFCMWLYIYSSTAQASFSSSLSTQTHCHITKSIPPLPDQGDLLEAINSGNLKDFKRCLVKGDDFLSANSHGFRPDRYIELLLEKSFNPHRNAHKEMFKLITIFKIKEIYGV